MASRILVAAWMLVGVLEASGVAQSPQLHPFSYHEGFEQTPPRVELWAHNGDSKVNFLGPTEEQAVEGQKSLKLDVTIQSGSYHYWGFATRVPCAGRLKLSARMMIAPGNTAHVGFGCNFAFPPTHHSGCGSIESFSKPTGQWKRIECDLVARGRQSAAGVIANYVPSARGEEVGAVLDRWAIFVTGSPGQRAVVYLDDVRIEGETPTKQEFDADVKSRWAKGQQRFQDEVQRFHAQIAAGEKALGATGDLPELARKAVQSIGQTAARAKKLLDQMAKRGYGSSAEMQTLETAVSSLRYGPDTIRAIVEATAAKQPYVLYTPQAITNTRLPSDVFPIPSAVGRELACSACRGEYEALSVAVYALEDLKGLTVSAGDLTGPAGTIAADAVDIRVVKCWYQAGKEIWDTKHKTYVPELLVKDERLVRVDTEKKENYLRSTGENGAKTYLLCSGPTSENLKDVRPVDAATLQPVDVPARSLKQFWLTVHIPDHAKAGTYQGTVTFRTAQGRREMPLRVTVHPFELALPKIIYSIYYRAALSKDGKPSIATEGRSEEQYRAEMADLQAHGVLYPTNYLGMDNKRLPRMLEIRREVGLPGGPFYNLGGSVGATTDPRALEALQQRVKKWIEFCKPYGYDTIYFYGEDEATGERLKAQRTAWKAVQEAGGKTFVACYLGTFEAMGGLLNCAVLAGRPNPEEGRKWHSVGSQAFCYAYPQVGNEEPETYRRHFGLELWKAGFDGAMDYAYQHGFHHVWNDFDDQTYRDHVFAYPTLTGVIDTIQWEGFREGVDDVRYLTTLLKLIEQAKANPAQAPTAKQAEAWVASIDPAGDLDGLRASMVQWILRLNSPEKK